ncbi:MAG: DNA translocase FtsK 4TM domain-containing protein [Sulfurospirillum cavolei]|nr:DNA translocase FtsK 4TM domain-containing protein [Sulfurospirillum cavolei]
MYLGVATVLPDASVVGRFGAYLGHGNQHFFGYLAFIYPFMLILPAFTLYKEGKVTERSVGIFVASAILFFAFLMAQSIIVHNEYNGLFGRSIVDLLIGFIGIMGVWIFILAVFMLSMTLLVESSISDFLPWLNLHLQKQALKSIKQNPLKSPNAKRKKSNPCENKKR